MTAPRIRPMLQADIDRATAAILSADWGDRRTWFAFATSDSGCRPIVADLDGEIVGTGVGTAHGPVGWVGTIWVAPAHRGAGLGRALTQVVIDSLVDAGCRTLLLVATDAGRRLYERMGFEVQTHYLILEATGLPGDGTGEDLEAVGGGGPIVRPFRPEDLAAIERLDRAATGEDRRRSLERFASPTSARVLDADGVIRGWVIRAPWGGGATVAPVPDDALRILAARRRAAGPSGRVRVGLLTENADGLSALERVGLAPIWSAPRLVRGDALTWEPSWIWGQFNHAMG
jgi:GNAT superfamily N-acetyltransferase